jgi:tRNA-splicing ligase RtcB (3'-phosphate/5'-hydroxy nucleic acid ligase)
MIKTNTKWDGIVRQIDDYRFVIPRTYKKEMLVDALVFSNETLIDQVCHDLSMEQAANVATLPGIVEHSLAMPDMHQGYGFPIGGVAAMDPQSGVVSPGGVGFDINCGVRLLTSSLSIHEARPKMEELMEKLYRAVPAGTGGGGRINLSVKDLDDVLAQGTEWAVEKGYATKYDIDHTEEYGRLKNADPAVINERAKKRGQSQLGTLGSGNHFLEVQYVDDIFDKKTAQAFGMFKGQLCIMIHCGSRGLGHQVCTDYVSSLGPAMQKYKLTVPDRELTCVPIQSPEGQSYLKAMAAAANFAWANRQCIGHFAEEALQSVFGKDQKLTLLFDVAHNIAKLERHRVDGKEVDLLVHRKGATRAFPAHRDEIPKVFHDVGQPVIIPGDMGTASYVLVGTERALFESFGSVCHGAGRVLSRTQARKGRVAKDVVKDLLARGVIAKSSSREGLTEEVSEAYKPIDEVVRTVDAAGLAKRVARLKPAGVVKG